MLCFSMNTDSLSVAPVRHPVVQISSELHAMTLTEGETKGESRRRPPTLEKLQSKKAKVDRDERLLTELLTVLGLFPGAGPTPNPLNILHGASVCVQVQYFSTVHSERVTDTQPHRCCVKMKLFFAPRGFPLKTYNNNNNNKGT